MGKCSKCSNAQASYYDRDDGPRRYCKQCARDVSNVVSRWQKDKKRKAEARGEGAGAGSGMGQDKKRALDGPPISIATLGLSPSFAATLDPGWLERQMPTAELLNDAGRLEWTAETTMVLDLTTHTSREEVATRIGEKLVQDYMAMAPVLRAVAHEMGVNEVAVGGVSRTGNHTPRHQHAPMGVLNLLGGSEGASKQWRLWPPGADGEREPITFEQRAGQVLWIPPGWQHEVFTTGGVVVELDGGTQDIVAPHWITWCLPKTLAMRSLCALLAGITREDQVSTNRTPKQKRELYEVLEQYSFGE